MIRSLIKNTRAQVGDTLTWIGVTILIVFIMMIFLAGVGFLSSKKSSAEDVRVYPASEEILIGDYETDLVMMNFFQEHKKEIFEWVDNAPSFKSAENMEDYFNLQDNRDKYKLYDNLGKAYAGFISDKGLGTPYFYIRTSDKEMWAISEVLNLELKWLSNNRENIFLFNFQPGYAYSSRTDLNAPRFFVVTDKGTLAMIVFDYERAGRVVTG